VVIGNGQSGVNDPNTTPDNFIILNRTAATFDIKFTNTPSASNFYFRFIVLGG